MKIHSLDIYGMPFQSIVWLVCVYITSPNILDFYFEHFLSLFGQILETVMKHSQSKFTPSKQELDWNNISDNGTFTVPSRF